MEPEGAAGSSLKSTVQSFREHESIQQQPFEVPHKQRRTTRNKDNKRAAQTQMRCTSFLKAVPFHDMGVALFGRFLAAAKVGTVEVIPNGSKIRDRTISASNP